MLNSQPVSAAQKAAPTKPPVSYLITLPDPRAESPRGPDGKGWNRLSINPMRPFDRCSLKPLSRQAALDTARGMAQFGNKIAYDRCVGAGDCSSCAHANRDRDDWKSTWLIRESERGHVWLLGNQEKGWSAYGYCYASWEALMNTTWLPKLERRHDETGIYWIEAES
ncbi:hypothetical protein [Paraburkholderia youngii]|uniref:hypothetical protein n=1 Tax=Paraburkholderia youngii TaxID=2782701 RepID=UPI003D222503